MVRARAWKAAAALTALAVVAVACGDDDDEATSETTAEASEASNEEFCELARELDAQEDFPSLEQLEQYGELAPEEIQEEAQVVVAEFTKATEAGDIFAAFEAPGVEEAFETIEPFEAEECGIEHEEEGEEEEEPDPSVTSLDPAAARVDVTATDYAFELTPPAAGRTSFVMTNEGAERHVMLLFRLSEGSTIEEALSSEGEEGIEEEWESDTATTGEEAVLTADLAPGEYGMICYIPTAEGKAHFELGMQTEFTIQ
ncbi:MAG: hypothetical protein Q8K58_00280 [Acidimicrobiales bacterium]|nr:hypothetical protein [Acidimicrobiales bacterium]